MTASPRQTLSFLQRLFEERGIRPKNKLGQNFLIDLNLIDLIVRTAELNREDLVLEVGTGTGSLTRHLAEQSGAVVTVEIDRGFHALNEELIGFHSRITLVNSDILKNKNELNPQIVGVLREHLHGRHVSDAKPSAEAKPVLKRLKLVSNMPYVVATPVISNLLLSDLNVERMVVTVQWEIAERLLAVPGTKPFGALAVLVQSLADVELVRRLGPKVFWPRPKVDSAIICVRPNPDKRSRVGDVMALRHFLRDLYVHRRKNLRGALAAMPGNLREKSEVDRKLAELGLDGKVRAEELDLEQHLRLCRAFGEGGYHESHE